MAAAAAATHDVVAGATFSVATRKQSPPDGAPARFQGVKQSFPKPPLFSVVRRGEGVDTVEPNRIRGEEDASAARGASLVESP